MTITLSKTGMEISGGASPSEVITALVAGLVGYSEDKFGDAAKIFLGGAIVLMVSVVNGLDLKKDAKEVIDLNKRVVELFNKRKSEEGVEEQGFSSDRLDLLSDFINKQGGENDKN